MQLKKPMKYSKGFIFALLGLLATLLGVLASVGLAGFLRFIEGGQHLLWNVFTSEFPLQPLIICTLGGVFVGLCRHLLGDHPKTLIESVSEIKNTGRLNYTHLPQGLVTVSFSLIFGASLGPESAIVGILGGLGTWIADLISAFRKRFHLPRPAQVANWFKNLLLNWPNVIALTVCTVVSILLLSRIYSGGFLHLHESFQWSDLLWSIPMAVVGAAGGALYRVLGSWTKKRFEFSQTKPVLGGAISGFILGLIASFLPMILFSGQHQLQEVYEQASQLGFWVLALIALARLFLVNLLLANGWKGGQFLPIMFSSAALGLSIAQLFPAISVSAAIFGTMAALVTFVLPKPMIVLIVMAIFFPVQFLGISAVAVGVVTLGQWLWKKASVYKFPKGKISRQSL